MQRSILRRYLLFAEALRNIVLPSRLKIGKKLGSGHLIQEAQKARAAYSYIDVLLRQRA
jgi:hypothetical protein